MTGASRHGVQNVMGGAYIAYTHNNTTKGRVDMLHVSTLAPTTYPTVIVILSPSSLYVL